MSEHYHQVWSEVVRDKVNELRQTFAERLGAAILGMVDYSPSPEKKLSDVEYAAEELHEQLEMHYHSVIEDKDIE